tara:strand:- start:1082 stop:2839 length:1758 start_codon:yes stop_codon:yes gene_type:complete
MANFNDDSWIQHSTKYKATRERIVDAVFNLIIKKGLDSTYASNFNQYKNIISAGQVTRGDGNKADFIVLYDRDYQEKNKDFYTIINEVTTYYVTEQIDFDPGNLILEIVSGAATEDEYGNYVPPAAADDAMDMREIIFNVPGYSGLPNLPCPYALEALAQFLQFQNTITRVDPVQASEILDTKIYELLPQKTTRQEQVNKFFADYSLLKGHLPRFDDYDEDGDIEPEEGYEDEHDISERHRDGVSDDDSFITRLKDSEDDLNTNKSLQWLRDDLNLYLRDIDQVVSATEPELPLYENKSDGFLKIRRLNQAIIVRSEEGNEIGMEREVENNGIIGPSYLVDGFTITMWVRFLDKVNSGTLFNWGNPRREAGPKGFVLETYTIHAHDTMTSTGVTWKEWVDSERATHPLGAHLTDWFQKSDYERFVRLVVKEEELEGSDESQYQNKLRSSGVAYSDNYHGIGIDRAVGVPDFGDTDEQKLLTYTRIPVDFNEWFFIVATYDPSFYEPVGGTQTNFTNLNNYPTNGSGLSVNHTRTPEYWNGNIKAESSDVIYDTKYIAKSAHGNRCKVEIISKSDLLRARGFRLPE